MSISVNSILLHRMIAFIPKTLCAKFHINWSNIKENNGQGQTPTTMEVKAKNAVKVGNEENSSFKQFHPSWMCLLYQDPPKFQLLTVLILKEREIHYRGFILRPVGTKI